MSQISMPMRILFVFAVVILVAWFTILKPKPVTAELPPAAPASTAPANANANANANAAAATPAATPGAALAVKDEQPAISIPADVLDKLPKDVAAALQARKTLVLGVFADDVKSYRPMADDDRYVRNALKKTNRYKGQVFVKRIGLAQLSKYAPLVNDLGVHQSPAVVVIDSNLKGTVLTGYVDRVSINQAIADARRASIDPYITDEYLREANQICQRFGLHKSRFSYPTIRGKKAILKTIDRAARYDRQWIAAVARVEAPAKWKSLKADWLRALRADLELIEGLRKGFSKQSLAEMEKAVVAVDFEDVRKLDGRFDKAGVTACVRNRQS